MPWDWIGIVMIRSVTPVHDVDERDDHPEPGCPRAPHPTQPEQHTLFILLDDLHRRPEAKQEYQQDDGEDGDQIAHGDAPLGVKMPTFISAD
jgi:hypothetical protein